MNPRATQSAHRTRRLRFVQSARSVRCPLLPRGGLGKTHQVFASELAIALPSEKLLAAYLPTQPPITPPATQSASRNQRLRFVRSARSVRCPSLPHAGLCKAHQLFGAELQGIVEELNQVLAA